MSATVEIGREQRRWSVGSGRPKKVGFRTDVQALRAIAVLAVVVNHFWPDGLTGGYVGVDVFFVISGFLITSHLDREIVRTSRVRFGRFYARRVRRLLPAAFLVLAVSVVLAYFLLPYPRWAASAREAFAAAYYVENWLLAAESVNYSAQGQAASLVQHYWSLSVEEQFYLFWPLLLIGLFKLGGRRWVTNGVVALGALSLGLSVYYTTVSPSAAYFITPVRVWEFALGAGVAMASAHLVLPRVAAEIAALSGLAMIIGAAFAYDRHTPFPGWLALIPAVGAGMVIISGLRPGKQWHTPLTASRPVQFVGDISYSLYLWHWPLVLLAPFALSDQLEGGTLGTPWLLGLLALCLVLAWATKVLVEDRGMSWGPLVRSTTLTFTGMAAGLAVVAVLATQLQLTYDRHVAQAERDPVAERNNPCYAANAMIATTGCAEPFGPARQPVMGPANEYFRKAPECGPEEWITLGKYRYNMATCDFSGGSATAQKVWLVGDSHAQHWQPAIFEVARERKWVLKFSYLGACPVANVRVTEFIGAPVTAEQADQCATWSTQLSDMIANEKPALVVTSFFAREETVDDGSGRSQAEQYREGVQPLWRKWTDAGARVIVLADPPYNTADRTADCVALHPKKPEACAAAREQANSFDAMAEAARTADNPGVSLIDLTDYFCDQKKCYAVIGNVAVYYDYNHLNSEFSRSLAPMIAKAIG
ncbi:acyltransferase family protein [Lentzea sp. NPDC006480]|uniref:acyltransferase family protein n=1 Tax=Lentzea sp. NPDC006480 TaxID=3157176 RepID=UPI0033B1837B